MHVHIAIFRWKPNITTEMINEALQDVAALKPKIPGILEIRCGENTSSHGAGYTHAVLVMGDSQEAINAYRNHPDHVDVAKRIDGMEEHGIGIDYIST